MLSSCGVKTVSQFVTKGSRNESSIEERGRETKVNETIDQTSLDDYVVICWRVEGVIFVLITVIENFLLFEECVEFRFPFVLSNGEYIANVVISTHALFQCFILWRYFRPHH